MGSAAEQPNAKGPEGAGGHRVPGRLNLPTRLSDQVPGLAEYRPTASAQAAAAGGALKISDRDRQETRKVRTMLASVGLFVVMLVGVVILAGSHSQPTAEERLAWNREQMALVQRVLMRTTRSQYEQALAAAANDPGKAIQQIVQERLLQEDKRASQFLASTECQSDADLWKRKRREKFILERALAWEDGYGRPYTPQALGMRLTVRSLGANGREDTEADLPKDDLTASVTLPTGEPLVVKRWEELFTLPDMSQVKLFDPGNPQMMAELLARDPDHLNPRERERERRLEFFNLTDEGYGGQDLAKKLREYELKTGILPAEDYSAKPPSPKPTPAPQTLP